MSVPKTMKAAILHTPGEPLRLENIPVPKPTRGKVLVKLDASGVCHTDLGVSMGAIKLPGGQPRILGHEGAGTIVELGDGVTNLKLGDRIGISGFHSSCGLCEYCTSGRENHCPKQEMTGAADRDGCFAEYALADATYAVKLPLEVEATQCASIFCAGTTSYTALKQTNARPGQWVAVIGVGGLGHLAIQYAIAMGLKVVAVDVREPCLLLAEELGADLCINAKEANAVERIQKEIGGAHAAVVTTDANEAFSQSLLMLRRCGTAVFVGVPKDPVPVNVLHLLVSGICIRSTYVGCRHDFAEALQFVADGKVKVHTTIEELDGINGVLKKMAEGKIIGRAVIKF